MADKLSVQQQSAVDDRGGDLLVSAAAGSGKTRVLVDRLISYLTDPVSPANIDDFLIITYTKAAAAELRGKIAAKLSEKIADEPENRHLQKQMQRLYLAKISTVHAFCSDLLRDYAYRLDISADFRVAEENECLELQLCVIDQILNTAYENVASDPCFCSFIDTQGLGRDDRQIPEIMIQVYNSARCHLNPEKWLDDCLAVTDTSGFTDASETQWGEFLIRDLHSCLDRHISAMEKCVMQASKAEGLEKPAALLGDTVNQLKTLRACQRWDDIIVNMNIDYGRLTFPRNYTASDLPEQIKAVREACKKGLEKKLRKFSDNSQRILQDVADTANAAKGLITLIRQFMAQYSRLKKSRRILDFSDLEHITLDLLLGKNRSAPTAIATEVGKRYREVMVDEYQDSNAVQDAIFRAITGSRNNCFMVGDVKQSIYQFRLADPTIFLEKYNRFVPAAKAESGEGRKIMLSNNYRSAGAVIEAVNHVFRHCMSVDVGGLNYGPDEALCEGLEHVAVGEPEVELYGIQVTEDTYGEEAAFVAKRILQLLDGTHLVRDGEITRPIRPEDIVILLRSPGSVGGTYAKALEQHGIRCSFGGSVNILETDEVETLRSILCAIDNPLQDIALIATLMSPAFGFTADDIAQIRTQREGGSIYGALRASDHEKAKAFLEAFALLRQESRMKDLSGILQSVLAATQLDSIYAAMPDGQMRLENLHTFCQLASGFETSGAKSLSRFLRHLEALDETGVPGTGEQTAAGAVTIMSIHKSKGLEFPVVFLCGLSRSFNRESLHQQILCDKKLGLGLSCVDGVNRVRYPSIAKRAIATKMQNAAISEELRILYVAMTRPKDRLIMTYASEYLENEIGNLVRRMDLSDPLLLTQDVDCPGQWVLYSALKRTEAGAFFRLGGYPAGTQMSDRPWLVQVVQGKQEDALQPVENIPEISKLPEVYIRDLEASLSFKYGHTAATVTPSKQTATQIKGREKDMEAAQDTKEPQRINRSWCEPTFVSRKASGRDYGNALHRVMQYISFDMCDGYAGVVGQLDRLVQDRYISEEERALVDPQVIAAFFETQMGMKLRSGVQVIREFKFSILDDATNYCPGVDDEKVLLQGVVDCAVIEDDGISIIDFKTDKVTQTTLQEAAARYKPQVMAYANALSRIYELPVKQVQLYFFHLGAFVTL